MGICVLFILFFWSQLTKSRSKGPANLRLPSSHSGDNIATSRVREEGRKEQAEEGETRRDVGRKEERVKKEGRRREGRREEEEKKQERGEGEREILPAISGGKKVPKEQRREMVR